ncbi:hypothetical protein EVAR_55839_1 [Eumeta japonica]|uniref:Uncharacterized protein n=1 Tax=Eumeta variegata TaxID=151549 RepID=A0A4C1YXL7_EUMVA|nr:hypothetical protein EVAR_55839_1 [Eumeta japonica]
MSVRSFAGLPRPSFYECRYQTEELMLPYARASSRRRFNPDGSGGNGPFSGGSINDGVMPVPLLSHPRAHACHRACAAVRWRGHLARKSVRSWIFYTLVSVGAGTGRRT